MRMQGNRERQAESLAVGLGWFSVALGLAELAVPRELSRLIGVPDDDEGHAIRAIECIVERPHPLHGGGADHFRLSDWQSLRVARVEVQDGHLPVADARGRT